MHVRDALETLRARVRLHVLLGICALMSLVALCVLIAVFLVLGLRNDQMQLHDRSIPYANAIGVAALNAKGIANDERGYLLTGGTKFTVSIEGRIRTARAAFAKATSTADGPAQYRAALAARTGFERWIDAIQAQFARFRTGDRQGARESALGPGRAIRKRYEMSLVDAQTLADHALHAGRASVVDRASRSVRILLASLLVAMAIGFVVGLWVLRTIVNPVYAILTFDSDMASSAPRR